MAAVGSLLAREGFRALGINALAREAGVDKVLIYRYFGGLESLLAAFGEGCSFWPSLAELVGENPAGLGTLPADEQLAHVLANYADALRRRPLTLEILAWETVARSPLTESLERIREARSLELLAVAHQGGFPEGAVDLPALSAVLGGAINYLLVRARTVSTFNGVELQTDAGWKRILATIAGICKASLATS